MKSEEMKILITGGSEGIGKGLATRFLRAGA
jgi:NAD(P)-dependent dehydrogenase (short-subunit alcohol dehydrogenase family)